jgi:sucrose-6-phosphate hydrolase SacC (GH32 family)
MTGAGWSRLVAASPLGLPTRWTHLETPTHPDSDDALVHKKALPLLVWGALRSLILLGAATATSGESCVGGPCGPAYQICDVHDVHRPDPAPPQPGPAFHLMHESCGENDPNGVVLDPVHGVLHYFMQLHVVTPAASGAPDAHGLASYGHFASRDAVHWTRLPVAIWNGVEVRSNGSTVPTPFDTQSIYSGSATVLPSLAPDNVSGGVMQIYPGLCRKSDWPACTTGTLLAAAVPADYASDPLLKRWRKLGPVVEGTQRDPSSAWQLNSGERRFRTVDAVVFGALTGKDMAAGRIYRIGPSNLPVGECPSVFTLPPATPGFETAYQRERKQGALPSHVFKYGARPTDALFNGTGRGGDAYVLGSFPLDVAKHEPTNVSFFGSPRRVDNGKYYASKDALVSEGRRWMFGWAQHVAVPGSGPQALPREISYNPVLKQLQWAPPVELQQLREETLVNRSNVRLGGSSGLDLGLLPGAGAQAEVMLRVPLPAMGVRLALQIMCDEVDDATEVDSSEEQGMRCTEVFIENATNTSVTVGVVPAAQNSTVVPDTFPQHASLRLVPGETNVEIRVFVDRFIGDAFFQQGRETFTFDVRHNAHAGMRLRASENSVASRIEVWRLGNIWVSEAEVLGTARMDSTS